MKNKDEGLPKDTENAKKENSPSKRKWTYWQMYRNRKTARKKLWLQLTRIKIKEVAGVYRQIKPMMLKENSEDY